MDDSSSSFRQHLLAFGSMAVIGLPLISAGGVAGFLAAKALTGFDWTQAPLETALQTITYGVLTLGGMSAATLPAIYLWLRFLRGKIEPDIVYHWLTAGPQPPILSDIAKRMFDAVYGENVGPGGRAV